MAYTKKELIISEKNKNLGISNDYNRQFSVSPLQPFSNTAIISASGIFLVDTELDAPTGAVAGSAFKYAPFNNLRIVNNSNYDVICYPNQQRSQGILIPTKTSQTIDNSAVKGFSSVLIENVGAGDIAISEIKVLLWKDAVTSDTLIKRAHEVLFN